MFWSYRWSARLGGTLFVLLVAAVCIVAPAQAAIPGAIGLVPTTVRLSPSSGPPGSAVTVRGTGFDPGICLGSAGLRWRGGGFTAVQRVSLNADGTFSTVVRAPAGRASGAGSARLVSSCGPGLIGLPGPRASFTVTAAAAPTAPPAAPTTKPTTAPTTEPTAQPTAKPTTQPTAKPTTQPTAKPTTRPVDEPTGGSGGTGGGNDGRTGGGSGDGSEGGSSGGSDRTGAGITPGATPGAIATTGSATSPAGGLLAVGKPSSTTGSSAGSIRPALITATIPTAAAAVFDPKLMLLAAGLAAVFIVLVAFPSELFNNTYSANATEIRALLAHPVRWLRRAAVGAGASAQQARDGVRDVGFGFLVFVGASTLLTVVLAGNEGGGGNWTAQILGMLIAITVVTLVAKLPAEFSERRYSGGIAGRFQVLPAAILVAVATTLLSRLLGLEPAYMYGLFAGFATAVERPLSPRQEGRAVLAGLGSAAAFGVACWLLWSPVHSAAYAGNPSWGAVLLDTALFWCFALATSGLVFSLIPLTFLDGATLRAWHPLAWFVPQVAAAAFFFYVFLLHGGSGAVSAAAIWRAMVFFALFGLVSVAFWAYFRWQGRPSHAVVADLERVAWER